VESSLTHKLWVQELPSEIIAQQLEPRLTDYSGNSFDAAPRVARDGEARGWMGSEGPLLIEPRKKSDKWKEVTGTLEAGAEIVIWK
jgi:hypothetical protein